MDWLEEWRNLFPWDPLTHGIIEGEPQKALAEIAASMWRLPAPSSAHLFTEGRCNASAPASAGGQPDASVSAPALGSTEGSAGAFTSCFCPGGA
ncbi:hypothetical protein AMECASPLE_038685 [Ameca splendens]|uniref:Uncharacterized protein n=1 Tax=Ameca splendens TaxID=208324 RepID=A0ABV0YWW4_9TELE